MTDNYKDSSEIDSGRAKPGIDPHDRTVTVVTVFGVLISQGSVLLIRRARDPYRGTVTVPGGHKLHGETLVEAAVREFREETSLTMAEPKLAGMLELSMMGDKRDFLSFYFTNCNYYGNLAASIEGELFWQPIETVFSSDLNLHPAFIALAPYFLKSGPFFLARAEVDRSGVGNYIVNDGSS
jgi:8-oxo-dGTP diphosphatase